jgi:lysophospholipase L1-like esterase
LVLLLLLPIVLTSGCRRVTLVSNSLICGDCLIEVERAINLNDQKSWVYTKYNWGGSTAFNNPINREIYSKGAPLAFSRPDVTVLSFGSNEMIMVDEGTISYESAVQSMQTLINQSVAAGSNCVVLVEASHYLFGVPSINPNFSMLMDDWFDHWHNQIGESSFLGIPYDLRIADISDAVHADPATYLRDFLHLNEAGAKLLAEVLVEEINSCPEGRWVFGENRLKEGASYPPNPYDSYPHPTDGAD